MKMKFSIFLYLLPFSLSVPPPPFPSFIVHPYLSQLTPLSPLFVIGSNGIYIWRIPNLKRNESESSHSSGSSDTPNLADYLSTQITTNWPEPPELLQSPSQLTKVKKLFSKDAYILLNVNEDNTCQLSYWMGKKSTLPKRRITARFVIRLIYDLERTGINLNLNYISREYEHRESAEFQMIFNFGSGSLVPTLYKLTETTDDLVKEVPLDYNELNNIDTFVLDAEIHIKIWSASLNERKKGIALILANYINTHDRLDITRKNNIQIGSELTGRDLHTFTEEFLSHLKNRRERSKFPNYSSRAPNKQVQEQRNQLQLFMYYIYDNKVSFHEVFEIPLTLTYFNPNNTYIMIDNKASRIFIFAGSHGVAEILEEAMAHAEQYNWELPESELSKITIIRNIKPYPTPFFIHFYEFRSFLNTM